MILLFSGGLDSFVAWHFLNNPPTLYVGLGHRYMVHEIEMVKKLIPATIMETNMLNLGAWEKKDANIPLRNAFLVMIASYYDKDVALIVQQGEMEIMTKTEMVRWYLDKGLDPGTLISTRSCFSPGDNPCGNCAACFRRWVAFTNCGLEEEYEQPIINYDGIKIYVDKMQRGLYDEKRTDETLMALKKAGIL